MYFILTDRKLSIFQHVGDQTFDIPDYVMDKTFFTTFD